MKELISRLLSDKVDSRDHTRKIVQAVIIGLIIISSISIIAEVSLKNKSYEPIFKWIELTTTLIFTFEYLLRIWISSENLKGISGFKKRLSYIFSFYGLIDLFSILPFYSGFFTGKHSLGFLKIIRIIRLLRLARYLKSFDFIINATKNKKSELFISMQIVLLFTFVLSVLLFFVEHKAQPENFSSIIDALAWSFSKFIGDIAGYGDFAPLTLSGKFLATAVGILSIAIFAVPAGIIASGFVEEIEAETKLKEVSKIQELIEMSFRENKNHVLGIDIPPRKRSIPQIQARLTLTEPEIFEAVRNSDHLRVIWDKSDPKSQNFDLIVIENKVKNRPYGFANLENLSRIRIINSLGKGERAISHFCQTLAKLGNHQLVSNEVFSGGDFEPETKYRLDINEAYTDFDKWKLLPNEAQQFCTDSTKDLDQNNWLVLIRSSASHRDLDFHITFGGDKGETNIHSIQNPTVHSIPKLNSFIDFMQDTMKEMDLKVGTHEDFKSTNPQLLHQYLFKNTPSNVITVFVSIELLSGPDRIYYQVIKKINDALCLLDKN